MSSARVDLPSHISTAAILLFVLSICSAAATRPNILLIVADDLGWNDVGFHSTDGNTQIPTPHIDELAKSGVAFNNYYVQPVCSPTRSCLMTGRHVIHTGIYDPDCGMTTTYAVPLQFDMLPKHLQGLNYSTAAIGKWHLGYFSKDVVPTGRGFDTFFGYYGGAEDYFTHKAGNHGKGTEYLDLHDDVGANLQPAQGYDGKYSTQLYAAKAVDVIQRHAAMQGDKSLFIYLAFQAIHSPDEAPQSYIDRFNNTIPNAQRRTVAGMVSALDDGIGAVVKALKDTNLMDTTTIVFTTDNGGPAQGFSDNMASNWPLRGMKRTLWEGGVRGVASVSGAGVKKTGYVSEAMLHAVDIPVSLLSLATNGVEKDPTSQAWETVETLHDPPLQLGDGLDAWAAIATGSKSPRTEIIHEAHTYQGKDDGNGQAIRVGDYKLIYEKGPMWSVWHGLPNDLWYASHSEPEKYTHTLKCGPVPNESHKQYCHPDRLPCLFNVKKDPCEYEDLSKTMPQKLKALEARLAVYQKTAVPVSYHHLNGTDCTDPEPAKHPEWKGTWMPFCK